LRATPASAALDFGHGRLVHQIPLSAGGGELSCTERTVVNETRLGFNVGAGTEVGFALGALSAVPGGEVISQLPGRHMVFSSMEWLPKPVLFTRRATRLLKKSRFEA
jgi:hypothetical protein